MSAQTPPTQQTKLEIIRSLLQHLPTCITEALVWQWEQIALEQEWLAKGAPGSQPMAQPPDQENGQKAVG